VGAITNATGGFGIGANLDGSGKHVCGRWYLFLLVWIEQVFETDVAVHRSHFYPKLLSPWPSTFISSSPHCIPPAPPPLRRRDTGYPALQQLCGR
jgi:hypothetical protein